MGPECDARRSAQQPDQRRGVLPACSSHRATTSAELGHPIWVHMPGPPFSTKSPPCAKMPAARRLGGLRPRAQNRWPRARRLQHVGVDPIARAIDVHHLVVCRAIKLRVSRFVVVDFVDAAIAVARSAPAARASAPASNPRRWLPAAQRTGVLTSGARAAGWPRHLRRGRRGTSPSQRSASV